MSVNIPNLPEARIDAASPTLGAVLFAREGEPRVPEALWVRLVRSIAAGDQMAFAEIYSRTHRLVFTLAMRIVGSRETAEELTVDVFHDVWRRASAYDEAGGTVIGWIMNQARSRAIDRLRFEHRQKRVLPHVDPNPEPLGSAAAADGSEHLVASREQGEQLRQAMTLLTADERAAIEVAFFADCTYAEVAERLGQPAGTIKTRIRSGLLKLRAALGEGDRP